MNSHETLRRFYARLVTASAGVVDPRIVHAFFTVRREQFVGPGPWQIAVDGGYMAADTDDPIVLYQDVVVGLFPDRRINNGEPSLHAKCLAAVSPKVGEVVIQVGAGTGYYTAILAELVGAIGRVHAYEIQDDIARRAVDNLAEYTHVAVHARSALEGPLPTADVIYVNAGATHVPLIWLDALALGGRLILPLTPNDDLGFMLMVTRVTDARYSARSVSPAAFAPCVGARDDESSRALAAALAARAPGAVRSLRRDPAADPTAWCVGEGWWLSPVEA
jgi:protein-L-isoaspartate(D-aspartate) O-methyltransferase